MGLIRKSMSVSTLGMVSYRSKEDRAAKYAKQTRNAARAQVAQQALALEHQRQMINQADHANVREEVRDMRAVAPPSPPAPQLPPAGCIRMQRTKLCLPGSTALNGPSSRSRARFQ